MYTCKLCSKQFKTAGGLGGHAAWHKNDGRCLRPLVDFDDLKKDCSRRERLIRERGRKCEVCKNEAWMGKVIPIELDHIDGHPDHNEKDNLRLICPNCHAQTEFYKGANVGRHKGTKRQEVMSRYPSYRKKGSLA